MTTGLSLRPKQTGPGGSQLLRNTTLLDQLRLLTQAANLGPGDPIPVDLLYQAIAFATSTGPFAEVVDEWTACDLLRCTRPTLRRYIDLGMPVIRLGGRKWYSITSIEHWLLAQQRTCAPRTPGRPKQPDRQRNGIVGTYSAQDKWSGRQPTARRKAPRSRLGANP